MISAFEKFYVDVSKSAAQVISDSLARNGLVTCDGIENEEHALALAASLGEIRSHRDSEPNGVTRVVAAEEPAEAGMRGFSSDGLVLHTDRSVVVEPPPLLFLWCEQPAERGGDTVLVDGLEVYEKLSAHHREIFEAVTKPNSAVFASDQTFYCGSIYQRVAADRICVRFRFDELFYMAPLLAPMIPLFRGFIDASAISFKLERGQGYILQNTRWLHGRRAFAGRRHYGRLHVNPTLNAEQLRGFPDPFFRGYAGSCAA
jgi:alpha-ketoglutarate-dependent taurine dioxygenase